MKRKRGRPKLATTKRRSKTVPAFRLTAEELRQVKGEAKQAGLSLSEYLRRKLLP